MKITADAASKNTGYDHTVLTGDEEIRFLRADKDGDVSFTLKSTHLNLSGHYMLRFKLKRSYLKRLLQKSETGYLRDRITELERELKAVKSLVKTTS